MRNLIGNLKNNLYGVRRGFIGLVLGSETFKYKVNVF